MRHLSNHICDTDRLAVPTIHFVYPRDPARHSSPWCIGNELGDRLQRKYRVQFYGWRDRLMIDAQPGDVLIGHPHWSRSTVFQRALAHRHLARRLILSPYVGDPRQVAFVDKFIDRCDLYLAITGRYWFDRVDESPMRRWCPKMRHLDLAVNRQHFPRIKGPFNPPGQRRFVYIGHTARNKNVGFLTRLKQACPELPLFWIGQGRDKIDGLTELGFMDFRRQDSQAVLASFDFMITAGKTDANPTTVLESLAWGLIPVCPPQSGYVDCPGIVNLPVDDLDAAVSVVRQLQTCDGSMLTGIRDAGDAVLQQHFHWDRFFSQVDSAINGTESPALAPARLRDRLVLWRHGLFH